MKAEIQELQRSFGEIRLFPETIDDLWHLEHLVNPGDLVFATTLRAMESASDKIRPEKMEKKQVRLGIRVEKVEFHPYANRVRLTGIIEQGLDTGAYHTLNIETGYEISLIKRWKSIDLERVDRAVKASTHDVLHIQTIEEGEAELFRMRQYGPEGVVTVSTGSGKGGETDTRAGFFERVAEHLSPVRGPVILAGPGFIKDDFMKYLRSRNEDLAGRIKVVETRRMGTGAVQEVIGLGIPGRIHEDMQLGREVRCMEELLVRIAKELPYAYGRGQVEKAVDCGAVEEVLVADSLIRDDQVNHLMERAELLKARITVFSTEFDPGRQLEALGGVAALLRYRVD